jgi:hypothetical protein
VKVALAEGGADAGVIGAGILAAQEIQGITNPLRDTAIGHPMTTEGSE